MKNQPLVSVIIPFFNRSKKTLSAIKSVLAQTYSHIELIVIDDGSDENELSVLTSFLEQSKAQYIRHTHNQGANAARNTGLKKATGSWIAYLDSDDTWEASKIEVMVELLLQHPEYSVAYCSMNKLRNGSVVNTFSARHSGNIYPNLLAENMVGSASVPLIKKTILEEVGGLDVNLRSAQDWDLWLRIAERGYLFLAISEVLVNYTLPDSKDHISGSAEAFWEGRQSFLKKHKEKYTDSNKPVLGQIYKDIAFLFLNQFDDRKKALACFLKSVRYNPLNVQPWKGLAGTLLPKSIYLYLTKNNLKLTL